MKTPNDGAQTERRAILRKIKRLLISPSFEGFIDGLELVKWIKARSDRTAKRKGGLGRK